MNISQICHTRPPKNIKISIFQILLMQVNTFKQKILQLLTNQSKSIPKLALLNLLTMKNQLMTRYKLLLSQQENHPFKSHLQPPNKMNKNILKKYNNSRPRSAT